LEEGADFAPGLAPDAAEVWERSGVAASTRRASVNIPNKIMEHVGLRRDSRKLQRNRGGRNVRVGWKPFTEALEC
jgi:hypothetical protein